MEAHAPLEHAHQEGEDLFPFPVVRDGQRQFLDDARSCIANRVHLLAHAPTGIGKTAVALTASLETTMSQEGFTFFLTARQSQHNAVIETSRYIWRKNRLKVVDIIAKEDSCLCSRKGERPPCTASSDCYFLNEERIGVAASRLLDYPLHVSEAQRLCLRLGACPHLAAMKALPFADLAVCDFNQVFNMNDAGLLGSTGRRPEDTVVVVDEAHNLPGRIIENHSASLSRARASAAFKSTGHRQFKTALRVLLDHMDRCAFENPRILDMGELDQAMMDEVGMGVAELVDSIASYYSEKMRHSLEDVVSFLRNWHSHGEASMRYMDAANGVLHCRFLEPGSISSAVLENVRCSLMMSGTLHPPEMFAELLGIRDVAACRRYPSPFPKENRQILVLGSVTSRYDARSDAMYTEMAKALADVCESAPGNVAAFFPSYEMMGCVSKVLDGIAIPKTIARERRDMAKAEKDAMIMDLRRERSTLLMAPVSGSFAEGVDFPDNLLSAVIVVGFPLSPPSLESAELFTRLAKKVGQRKASMYTRTYPAVTKVLQSAGRAIRSETDRASIVLLDDRYLSENVKGAFPDDFRMERCDDLKAELRSFHETRIERKEEEGFELPPS